MLWLTFDKEIMFLFRPSPCDILLRQFIIREIRLIFAHLLFCCLWCLLNSILLNFRFAWAWKIMLVILKLWGWLWHHFLLKQVVFFILPVIRLVMILGFLMRKSGKDTWSKLFKFRHIWFLIDDENIRGFRLWSW